MEWTYQRRVHVALLEELAVDLVDFFVFDARLLVVGVREVEQGVVRQWPADGPLVHGRHLVGHDLGRRHILQPRSGQLIRDFTACLFV